MIADRFATLIADVAAPASSAPTTRRGPALAGLWAMCDDVGILQHGVEIVPDRNHGYCIDDNARALMFAHGLRAGGEAGQHMLTFASFRSEEHTSELQSLLRISYAVLCLQQPRAGLRDRPAGQSWRHTHHPTTRAVQ